MTVLQKRIVQRVQSVTGLNPMRNTRKREYVEARALLIFLLRDVCNMYLSEIARFFQDNGKPMHHATVLHSIKNFEIYMQFSKKFREQYDELLAEGSWGSLPAKKAYVKNKIDYIPEEAVDEVYQIVSSEYRI